VRPSGGAALDGGRHVVAGPLSDNIRREPPPRKISPSRNPKRRTARVPPPRQDRARLLASSVTRASRHPPSRPISSPGSTPGAAANLRTVDGLAVRWRFSSMVTVLYETPLLRRARVGYEGQAFPQGKAAQGAGREDPRGPLPQLRVPIQRGIVSRGRRVWSGTGTRSSKPTPARRRGPSKACLLKGRHAVYRALRLEVRVGADGTLTVGGVSGEATVGFDAWNPRTRTPIGGGSVRDGSG
jgi:hypothetical protein